MLAAAAVAVVAAAVVILNPLTAQTQSDGGLRRFGTFVQAYAGREIEAAGLCVKNGTGCKRSLTAYRPISTRPQRNSCLTSIKGAWKRMSKSWAPKLKSASNEIGEVLEAVARENGVTVVVDRAAVVWGGVDLTGEVLRRLGVLD